MTERIMSRGFPWGEPAHPGIVRYYDDLIAIYRVIRGQMQQKIDEAFDGVSRQIGFVVTTTIPVTMEVADEHKGARWTVGAALKGSLFEEKILGGMAEAKAELWKAVSPGKYNLYLVWYDALKLKLRKDWLEPVHFLATETGASMAEATAVRPEVQEPAHWFIPGERLSVDEKVLISVIDEVYPELRLADRIAATRQMIRQVQPEVMEPVHPRPDLGAGTALREIGQLLRRVQPGVMEPAHFRLSERDFLAEIEAIVRKYGG
jgi:hypothetical protein